MTLTDIPGGTVGVSGAASDRQPTGPLDAADGHAAAFQLPCWLQQLGAAGAASAGTQRPAPTHSYGNANSKRVIVTSGQGGLAAKPSRPNSAAPQAPRTLTTIDNASEYAAGAAAR